MHPLLELWFSSGRFLDFHGHRIFYRYSPKRNAPTILLLHGFPSASWDFSYIWPKLKHHFGLLTFDFLGLGFSDKPARHRYSIFEQADLAEAVLSHCGVKKCHILAHDYGVSVAQELLARHGHDRRKLLSVCFLNGGLYPEHHRPLWVQRLLLSPLGPVLARLWNKNKLRQAFNRIFGQKKASGEEIEILWQLVEYNNGRRAIPKLMQYMPERRKNRARWVGALEKTRVPLAMINGAVDPISGEHLAMAFAEQRKDAWVKILPDCGHYPHLEAPQEVAKLYLRFLRGR